MLPAYGQQPASREVGLSDQKGWPTLEKPSEEEAALESLLRGLAHEQAQAEASWEETLSETEQQLAALLVEWTRMDMCPFCGQRLPPTSQAPT